jgi:hypothetical protein
MADKGIKKAVVKKEDLPSFNGKTQKYSVRYRIVSDDKNRYSHWSPYHSLSVGQEQPLSCSVSVNNKIVNMVWAGPTGQVAVSYDIYFKFGSEEWKYIATTLVNQFSSLLPDSVSTVQVALHRSTYPKTYSSSNAYFTSNPILV